MESDLARDTVKLFSEMEISQHIPKSDFLGEVLYISYCQGISPASVLPPFHELEEWERKAWEHSAWVLESMCCLKYNLDMVQDQENE